MTILRRFLVIQALLFWQGGFLFYTAVVVPLGQGLHGHTHQGFLTREVTYYLNLAGAVALVVLLWDVVYPRRMEVWRQRALWLAWIGLAVSLIALFLLHQWLDQLLEPETMHVIDRKAFYPRHRMYLWVSTMQWALGALYSFLSLVAWRVEDKGPEEREETGRAQ